jgi:hypothetical protein
MSKYKDIMKNGWHPEKSGTTFKGQVVSNPLFLPTIKLEANGCCRRVLLGEEKRPMIGTEATMSLFLYHS